MRSIFSLTSVLCVVFSSLFSTATSSIFAASVRWSQVDKGVASYAYRARAMMIQKDKITSINQLYGVLMFDGTKWHTVTDKMTFPRGDFSMNMFLDSRGIIYVGGVRADYTGSNTPYSFIFESTDGLHFTPVQQFIDATGEGKIWNFTEDKYGNVWAGEYTTHSKTTGGHLWRRRPNGIWTNVANWAPPEDHIHQVYYCPFRDALYVAIGDRDHGILKLSSDKINADGISASDFNFILPIDPNGKGVEVTAITSDSLYIYVGMDMHAPDTNARSIARITDSGISQSMEYVYPLAGCGVWGWADVDDAGNIIFSVRGINEWSCTDNYVNQILVSNDHGTTWTIVKDFGSSPTSSGMDHTGLASYYATNWSGLYGAGNSWGGKSLRGTIGRVLPTNATFYVDENNGVDWTNFGIDQARPIKTLNYLELLDIYPGDTVVFTGTNTYSSPLIAGWSGNEADNIYLRGNTTSIFSGGNVAPLPAVAETFESAKAAWNFTLNEAGGSITADTSIVHEGVQSAKIVRGSSGTTSLSLKNVTAANVAENDKFYISYWVYYPNDITPSNDTTMLRMYDNANYEMILQIRPSSVSHLKNEITFITPPNYTTVVPSRKSLTSGTWHKIDIEAYMHFTSGYFKMYVDDELWFFINGIKTITSSAKLNNVQFFLSQNPITFYIDDFKFGKLPFVDRGAIDIHGHSYLDIGNFKVSGNNGALISGSNNINLYNSIFHGLTNDAIIIGGDSTSLNFYQNTIFGSGRYGINAMSNATLKNNLVYGSVGNDVFIGNGVTLTGNNNWFEDFDKVGAGTYADTGSTTWLGANPVFVNSEIGDFHLRTSSPLIDAGATVPGVVSDFPGVIRPQGLAPDIGAYEYVPLTVTITSPTSGSTYITTSSLIDLAGSASDSTNGLSSVSWSNNRGGSGIASGTTNWTVSSINLLVGDNIITVTVTDNVGNTGEDTISVTCTVQSPMPDQFTFTDQINVPLSTLITSNAITVSGIDVPAAISVTGGEYSVNGGAFIAAADMVSSGATVVVRQTSSASAGITTDTVLTIGGVMDTFSVTTLAADSTPDPFVFTDQTNVALSTLITSNAITVSGLDVPAAISVTGGEYAVNGGAFTAAAGTVSNGATVVVRQTSSATAGITTDTALTIGGITDTFSVTTSFGTQGLMAHYAFDEGSGTIATDSSGNNNHGTINGATWSSGKMGGGLSFNGFGNNVSIPRMNYEEISFSAWFYKNVNDTTNADALFGGWFWDSNVQIQEGFDLRFYQSSPDTLEFILVTQNGTGTKTKKNAQYNLTNSVAIWYHVACTYNKTTGEQKLYVNGQLSATQTHPAGNTVVPLTLYPDMRIGYSRTNNGYFNGIIDDVRLYNYTLSEHGVLNLFNIQATARQ